MGYVFIIKVMYLNAVTSIELLFYQHLVMC